ncbi:MAG: hypothetical protein ACTSX6_02515 [Candidatus Heimdallarchaeaceae archaeon]
MSSSTQDLHLTRYTSLQAILSQASITTRLNTEERDGQDKETENRR